MSTYEQTIPDANPYLWAGVWSLAVLMMTAIHHIYGAIVYETPWRLHIVFVAVPIALVIAAALTAAYWRRGTSVARISLGVAQIAILGFCVAMIGIYEGGYNHVVSNIVFLTYGAEAVAAVYGIGIHEVPNDAIFEITGVAQFFLALVAAWASFRLWRAARDA